MQANIAGTLVLVFLGGCARAAQPNAQALFAQASTPIAVGRTISVTLLHGTSVTLTPVRFSPRPGLTAWVAAKWCGLEIATQGKRMQAITVIGQGHFEALSCDGLKAAGSVPPAGKAPRIGLIYATQSPNFTSTTSVVLVRTAEGQWETDDSVNSKLDALQVEPTLDVLQQTLTKHKKYPRQ